MHWADHTWSYPDEDLLIAASKSGDMIVIDNYDVVQVLPYDPKASYTALRAFTGGFVAATEDGMLNFYKQVTEIPDKIKPGTKPPKFEFVRRWTCSSLKN